MHLSPALLLSAEVTVAGAQTEHCVYWSPVEKWRLAAAAACSSAANRMQATVNHKFEGAT